MRSTIVLSAAAALMLATGCSTSKITCKYPLDANNKQAVTNVSTNSRIFGQLDVAGQSDSSFYLFLKSGFYDKNHFSMMVKAQEINEGKEFVVRMYGSRGEGFVRNLKKAERKAFLAEIQEAVTPKSE